MTKFLEKLVIVLVATLTFSVLWGVISRFCLGHQASYTDELARVLLVWISMTGSALAFKLNAHLGVDYVLSKLNISAQRTIIIISHFIIIALIISVFLIGGTSLAFGQWHQTLPTLPILTRGMVYAAIPFSGLFITIFSVQNLIAPLRTTSEATTNIKIHQEGLQK